MSIKFKINQTKKSTQKNTSLKVSKQWLLCNVNKPKVELQISKTKNRILLRVTLGIN